MSTAVDISNYLSVYSGAADRDTTWDGILSSINLASMIKMRDEFMAERKLDNIAGTRRFILHFCTTILPKEYLDDLRHSSEQYIISTDQTIDSLGKHLEKADMAVATDRVASRLLVQTQVQIIHSVCTAAQTVADIARSKVTILQGNVKFAKAVIEACESLNVVAGKVCDSREMTAFTQDLKLAQTVYEQIAKQMSVLADRAEKVNSMGMRRDSAIRMLINQMVGGIGSPLGEGSNINPEETGMAVGPQTGIPPGFDVTKYETSL